MAITQVGSVVAPAEVNNANFTITEPTGTAQDDYLVVWVAHKSTIGYETPAGWTKLLDQSIGDIDATDGIASGELFYIKRGASAPTLTFVKQTGTGNIALIRVTAWRGIHLTSPVRDSDSVTQSVAGNTPTTKAISPLSGDLVLMCLAGGDNYTWSAQRINGVPTLLTEMWDAGTNTGADTSTSGAALVLSSNISSQTTQATCSVALGRNVIGIVVFQPAPEAIEITNAGAIASAEAFSTHVVAGVAKEITNAGGIAGAEAFGTAIVAGELPPVEITNTGGIVSLEAFETHVVTQVAKEITNVGGITSAEVFGVHTITQVAKEITNAGGIPSAEAFQTANTELGLIATGIVSAEAFGLAVITQVAKEITNVGGLSSAEAFETHVITQVAKEITDAGNIPTAEVFGTHAVAGVAKELTNAGNIPGAESFGLAVVSGVAGDIEITNAGGISSAEVFGLAVVAGEVGAVEITSAGGIPGAEVFGLATITQTPAELVVVGGISTAEAFGNHYVLIMGAGEMIQYPERKTIASMRRELSGHPERKSIASMEREVIDFPERKSIDLLKGQQ